jgi:hypothetical protein
MGEASARTRASTGAPLTGARTCVRSRHASTRTHPCMCTPAHCASGEACLHASVQAWRDVHRGRRSGTSYRLNCRLLMYRPYSCSSRPHSCSLSLAPSRISLECAEPSPGADVARASQVPVQMWPGMNPVPVQMWPAVNPIPVQIWHGWAHVCMLPAGPALHDKLTTGPLTPTSAPGPGPPLPHSHRGWADSRASPPGRRPPGRICSTSSAPYTCAVGEWP